MKKKVAPAPSAASHQIRPPWVCTIFRAIDSPIPVPGYCAPWRRLNTPKILSAVRRIEADAVVANRNHPVLSLLAAEMRISGADWPRILDAVGDQILEELGQLDVIAHDLGQVGTTNFRAAFRIARRKARSHRLRHRARRVKSDCGPP